ncbi:phospholipase-like protein [Tanacetum coccineum]
MMGKMSFFLGLQISQSPRGIFLNQSKYALEIIKKYGMETNGPVDTPIMEKSKLDEELQGKAVDPTHYHGMIGSLMYLTSSRPDLVFVVCICARYQAKHTEKHLHATLIMLVAKILEEVHLVVCNWLSKKQKRITISSTEVEYIALSGCCFIITNLDIIGVIEDEEMFANLSDDDAIRLCLLLAVEVIFIGRLLTFKVDDTLFRHTDENYYGLKKDRNYVPTYTLSGFVFAFQLVPRAPPIKEQHSLFETCLAKLEKACKPGKTGFIVSSIGGTSDNSVKKKWLNDLVIMELNYRVFKLKTIIQDYLREEELRLCLEDEEMLRCEHEKLIVKDNRFRLDEAKRLRNFWLKLVCLDPARKGWLTEEVFILINEMGEHWCLAQFHILSGDVTFYDTGYAYDCDYHDWYVKEMHEQILELQSLVGSNVAAKSVRLLKEFQYDDLESTRGMMRLICETQLKVQLLVVLERVNVFQKKGIYPSKYTITFRLVDNVPKQEGIYGDCGVWVCILLYRLAHGLSLDVDDLVDVAMTYREKMV